MVGIASGCLLGLVHAFFAIHLRADQIVGGTAINFLALGITGYLYNDIYGNNGTPDNLPAIPNVHLGFLSSIPPHGLGSFLMNVFGGLNLMIWISYAVLVLSWLILFRTAIGLRIRSVGEHPRAADTVGISVYGIRYVSVVTSGGLAAMGGVFLSIGFVNSFTENMTAGRGFIALAALIFGKWRPFGAFAAAPDYYFRKGEDLTKITEMPKLMPLVNSKPDAELLAEFVPLALTIKVLWPGYPLFLNEFLQFRFVLIEADTDDFKPFRMQCFIGLFDIGDFGNTRPAPGRPEVDEHDFAL